MTVYPQNAFSIPTETACLAHAAYHKGNYSLRCVTLSAPYTRMSRLLRSFRTMSVWLRPNSDWYSFPLQVFIEELPDRQAARRSQTTKAFDKQYATRSVLKLLCWKAGTRVWPAGYTLHRCIAT